MMPFSQYESKLFLFAVDTQLTYFTVFFQSCQWNYGVARDYSIVELGACAVVIGITTIMVFSPSEQLLVDALSALPPNNVYADAGKREILNGFKLFMDRRVTDIAWQGEGVILLELAPSLDGESVRGAAVRVSMEGEGLRWRCSHPEHDGGERCGHIVCAILTVVHLFRPNLFKLGREEPAYRHRLEAGLYKRGPAAGSAQAPVRSVRLARVAQPGR